MSTISHNASARQFTATEEGHQAQLDYTLVGSVMTISHTRVPKPIEGRGIAAQMMACALQLARANKWSVDPACSYAAAYLQKHPQEPTRQHMEDLLDEALQESFPASDSPSVGGSS